MREIEMREKYMMDKILYLYARERFRVLDEQFRAPKMLCTNSLGRVLRKQVKKIETLINTVTNRHIRLFP